MLSLASHILDSKAGRFEPSEFKDEFETELRKLVRRKAAGKPIAYEEPVEPPSNVVNLMETLRRSVEGTGGRAAALSSSSSPRKGSPPKARKGLHQQTHAQARRLRVSDGGPSPAPCLEAGPPAPAPGQGSARDRPGIETRD